MKKVFMFLAILIVTILIVSYAPTETSNSSKNQNLNREKASINQSKNKFSGKDVFMALYFADNSEILDGIDAMNLEIKDFQDLTKEELVIYYDFREAIINELININPDYFKEYKNGITNDNINIIKDFYLQGFNDIRNIVVSADFQSQIKGRNIRFVLMLFLFDQTHSWLTRQLKRPTKSQTLLENNLNDNLSIEVVQIYNNL